MLYPKELSKWGQGNDLTIEQDFSRLSQPSPKLAEERKTQVMGEKYLSFKGVWRFWQTLF